MEDFFKKAVWHRFETTDMKKVSAQDLQAELAKAGYGWVLNAQVDSKPLVKDVPDMLLGAIVSWEFVKQNFFQGLGYRGATQPELRAWVKKFPLASKTVVLNTIWVNRLGNYFLPVCETLGGQNHWTMVSGSGSREDVSYLMVIDP